MTDIEYLEIVACTGWCGDLQKNDLDKQLTLAKSLVNKIMNDE